MTSSSSSAGVIEFNVVSAVAAPLLLFGDEELPISFLERFNVEAAG